MRVRRKHPMSCSRCGKCKKLPANRKTCAPCLKKKREYHARNRGKENARKKAWRKKNKESEAARNKLRKWQRNSAPGTFTRSQLEARFCILGNRCWICGTRRNLTIDHVKPLSKGGSNWPSNLRSCCSICNTLKGDYWPATEPRNRLKLIVRRVNLRRDPTR